MQRAEIENNAIAGIIRDTNIDLLGNSKGEKEEIVRRIRIPAIIAASVWIISLPLISSLVPDGFILKILIILHNIKYVCFYKTVELFKNKSLAYPFPLCYVLHFIVITKQCFHRYAGIYFRQPFSRVNVFVLGVITVTLVISRLII